MLTSRGGSHEVADDSVKKTISVALGVCIICSILVSSAAVALRGIQIENQRLDRIKNILIAGDLFTEGADIRALYEEKIEPRMIDLTTGETVLEENLDGTLNIVSISSGQPLILYTARLFQLIKTSPKSPECPDIWLYIS
jgi:Na+-transporting NADH:ubiquinone oxidoreductase subunit NqrC